MKHGNLLIGTLLAALFVCLGATSASAYATTMTSNFSGLYIATGDTVTITVSFDSEGEADISLLSVSVLFSDDQFSLDEGASSSPSYALYVAGGKANQYLIPASTNMTLRTGTSDQILLDWQNTALPGGNRDPGSFDMATLVFRRYAIGWSGVARFALSNSSPGNILQLSDGSNPTNHVSGDFDLVPEPSTALLVGLGLAGLGVAGRRRS
ncbi:MAG: PEP-CTERM sorting domain-containing protein [Myxococcota bacterium]|nr:PEP-CTERM sorting domain-containing protein [Myxococcota bacterium]